MWGLSYYYMLFILFTVKCLFSTVLPALILFVFFCFYHDSFVLHCWSWLMCLFPPGLLVHLLANRHLIGQFDRPAPNILSPSLYRMCGDWRGLGSAARLFLVPASATTALATYCHVSGIPGAYVVAFSRTTVCPFRPDMTHFWWECV